MLGALVLGAASLVLRARGERPPPELRSTSSNRAVVIRPGREREVQALLGAFGGSFMGRRLGDVRIDGRQIRAHLVARDDADGRGACPGPAWVRPPGGLRVAPASDSARGDAPSGALRGGALALTWWRCEGTTAADAERAEHDARAALPRMIDPSRSHVQRIWQAPTADGPAPTEVPGLLAPLLRALGGLEPATLTTILWLLCIAVAIGMARLTRPAALHTTDAPPVSATAPPDAREARIALAAAIAVVVAGAAMRIAFAATLALDSDEHWAFPSSPSTFSGVHDTAVHPPLFRALQEGFGRAIGWRPSDPLILLRLPSLLASIASLALLAAAAHASRARPRAFIALVFVALAPQVCADAVLARPYGLAAATITMLVVGLFSRSDGDSRGTGMLRLSLALAAVAVATWLDLVAGLAACIALAVFLASPGVSWRTRLLVAGGAVLIVAPLVPGALDALATQVHPLPSAPGVPSIDLGASRGLGGGDLLAAAGALATFTTFGEASASGLFVAIACAWWIACALAASRHERAGLLVLLATSLVLLALGTHLGLRPRNVLFLPHLGAFVATACAARGFSAIRARWRR